MTDGESNKETNVYARPDFSEVLNENATEYIKKVTILAIPSVLSSFLSYSMQTMNFLFASNIKIENSDLNNVYLVDAIGSGNIFINFFGFLFGLGMINSLETLCSQDYGRNDLKQLSKWAKLCFYFMTVFFIFVIIISCFSYHIIFYLLKQNEIVSNVASTYIYSLIPTFLAHYYLTIYTKILNSQQIYTSILVINFSFLILHPLWCFIFFYKLQYYYYGLGIAQGITTVLILLALRSYCKYYNLYQNVNFSEITKKDIIDFSKMSIQCGILYSVDLFGFELVSIVSSYLPSDQLTANITTINIYNNVYCISIGFATTLTTLVGNYIGEERLSSAIKVSKIGVFLNLTFTILLSLICIIFNYQIANFYITDSSVLYYTSKLIRLMGIFIIFDSTQLQLNGIIRGIGKQFNAIIMGFIIFFFIQSFFTYFFTYKVNMGVYGIWFGLILSTFIAVVVYGIYLMLAFKEMKNESFVKVPDNSLIEKEINNINSIESIQLKNL